MRCTGLAVIGKTAELRYTHSNNAVTNLYLAFPYGKKYHGQPRPIQWVDVSLWGNTAEALIDELYAGRQILATINDLHTQPYHKADGTTAIKLAGILTHVEFVQDGLAPPEYYLEDLKKRMLEE